jgi:hypothetical protein
MIQHRDRREMFELGDVAAGTSSRLPEMGVALI